MNDFLVSICLITYNHENYIAHALESVLMQKTKFDFEIIIGEDCSTDTTKKIVIDYKNKNPKKIKTITSEKNVGSINNAIRTMKACRGKYIAIIEGDDYWIDPFKLQKQVDFLEENPDYSLCFHDALILWDNKSRRPRYFCAADQKQTSTIEDVIEKWFIPSASMVFKSEYIKPFPDWFKDIYNGDYALHLLLANNGKILYINKVMSVYHKNKGNLSANIDSSFIYKQIIVLLNIFDKQSAFKYHQNINKRLTILSKMAFRAKIKSHIRNIVGNYLWNKLLYIKMRVN